MMADNFGQKIVISMKSTNMPVLILPKTKSFKVVCVFIANYGVSNEKSEIHGLPGVLKMLTMEKSKKPKLTKKNFHKTAFIYHRFILFNSKKWYDPLSKKHQCWWWLFVCLFSYANATQFSTMKWLGHTRGPKTRIGISMSRILIVIFFMIFAFKYMNLLLGVRNLGKFVFT